MHTDRPETLRDNREAPGTDKYAHSIENGAKMGTQPEMPLGDTQ